MSKITAQLYTLRDFCKTSADLAVTLEKVAKIGYKSVQVSGVGPIDPQELKTLLDKNGLDLIVTHTPYAEIDENLDQVIANHKLWNCKYIGLGSMPAQFPRTKEGFAAFMEKANKWAEKIDDAGLKFVYHNHHFEFVRFDGMTGLEYMIANAGRGFQFEIDTFWVQAGGSDPAEYIRKVAGKMDIIHFKDFDVDEKAERRMREVGEGNLNWKAILKACEDTGIQQYIVEQDNCNGLDPFEALAISYKNLKDMGVE
ncbi:MAG: sugar phosphate isomerase/epimerase [Ruminococcaceae bacterium]|nr:sugar phosphate isomerase/epimerase [Oscillospiraceae bacterium]